MSDKTPVTQRRLITDPRIIRAAIHEKIVASVKNKFPIVGKQYTANIRNVEVRFEEHSHSKQRELLTTRRNASDGVYADLDVTDNATGLSVAQVKNRRLMNIPYYTNRYTMMLDGNEYSIISQMRTKPGVYTRKRGNDELESSFNLSRGANFKLIMNPDSGLFKISILNSTLLAVAVLKILGATSADVLNALGEELTRKNMAELTDSQLQRARNTLYEKLVKYQQRGSATLNDSEKDSAIRQYFMNTEIDPETTRLTLGTSFTSVGALTILSAMKKILSVYSGEDDFDERDLLEFQKIYGIEDLLSEVVDKSKDIEAKIRSRLDKFKPEKDPDAEARDIFSAEVFTGPLHKFIVGSSLARLPSQINPLEFVDSASIITRLGEGAISTERAVPFETRGVNGSYMGIIDPIAAPESSKVGIDAHCTMGAIKGSDNEFYKEVLDCRSKQKVRMRALDLHDKYVGFPDPIHTEGKRSPSDKVAAIFKGKLVHVQRSQLDYQIASPHDLTTVTTNTLPFMPANQGNRLLMGDKHVQQALPLKAPDKRLVKSKMSGTGYNSTVELLGSWTVPKAPADGTVYRIDDEYVYIRDNGGKTHRVDYENNLPLATKTFLHNNITVKVGDKVTEGQPLGDSNFSRDGELTMGRNLTVAYMPWEGYNHEDGVVLSEAAAKKMTSVHSDKVMISVNNTMVFGKEKYTAAFPTKFTLDQLAKLDDEGLARKGEILEPGDPIILCLENNSDSRVNQILGLVHKSLKHPFRDSSEVYEGQYPAEVVAAASTSQIKTVVLKIEKPLQIGDKVAGSYGNKGVCSKILPDDQMPRGEDGKPLDAVFTSAGVISRINAGQILESSLGKVALKTGKAYEVENYGTPDYVKFVREELKKHNVKDKETVTDPVTGKKIPNVFVGVQHCHKLFKTTDTNFSARGIEGPYDQNEAPSGSGVTGPKALGGMEVNALLAHNARALLREGTALRSGKNLDFWKQFQSGGHPSMPMEKKTFSRFAAILKQAGINVTREGNHIVAAPLTDRDVLELSAGEMKDAKRIDARTMKPEDGGLYDVLLTGGLQGTRWTHVKLTEPVVNPVFEDAAKLLLGKSSSEFSDMIVQQGGQAIRDELNRIDVATELKKAEDLLYSGKVTQGQRDITVKRVKYLRTLKERGITAGEAYVLSVVPVMPPVMRPVVINVNGDKMENDATLLYRDLILQNNRFQEQKNIGLGDDDIQEARRALNKRVRELVGIAAPESPVHRGRGVKGALAFISGDTPKEGYFQRTVIYGKMNLTGRATISPDNTLGLDEIGLPETAAWEMYKPFITRRLVQIGYSPLQAMDAIAEKSPSARKALEDELEKRPVIVNRAPTLWRHGILAARPRLRDGKNLQVNSIWEKGLNADYDGDAMQIHLPVSDEAIEEAKKMFPSQQLFTDKKKGDLLQAPSREPIIGLYKVTENVGKPIRKGSKVHKFPNVEAAWKAYYDGKLKMTDYVEIGV